jgi:hypothetical protein
VNCRPLKDRSCRSRAVCRCLTMPQLYPAGLAPTNLQQNHCTRGFCSVTGRCCRPSWLPEAMKGAASLLRLNNSRGGTKYEGIAARVGGFTNAVD